MEIIEEWHTSLTKIELITHLKQLTEPVEELRLVSRLSGAGIVVRALEMPETNQPFIGNIETDGFRIAQCLPPIDVSPYQPIIVGRALDEHRWRIEFSPHKDVYMLSAFEWLGGGVCVLAGGIGMSQNPLAVLALVLGVAIVALPRYRAKWNFNRELNRAREALKALPIDWSTTSE